MEMTRWRLERNCEESFIRSKLQLMSNQTVSLRLLVSITILNYAAQIPYFFHYYYSSSHPLPAIRASILLGFTLLWFLCGVVGYRRNRWWGFATLTSFLFVEALFYILTIATGTFIGQLRNHPYTIDVVFIIGYLSGLTAAYYFIRILKFKGNSAGAARRQN